MSCATRWLAKVHETRVITRIERKFNNHIKTRTDELLQNDEQNVILGVNSYSFLSRTNCTIEGRLHGVRCMKRSLFGTSALVAASMLFSGQASAAGLEASLNSYMEQWFGFSDQDEDTEVVPHCWTVLRPC